MVDGIIRLTREKSPIESIHRILKLDPEIVEENGKYT
jgi:hypothetical protein